MRTLFAALVIALGCVHASAQSPKEFLEQGRAAEARGDGKAAVKAYIGASRTGSADAARRLAQIYGRGELGVERNDAESMKWASFARRIGDQEGGWGCPPKCPK